MATGSKEFIFQLAVFVVGTAAAAILVGLVINPWLQRRNGTVA